MTCQMLRATRARLFIERGETLLSKSKLFQVAWERGLAGAFRLIINNQSFASYDWSRGSRCDMVTRSCRGVWWLWVLAEEQKRARYEGNVNHRTFQGDICSFRSNTVCMCVF